MPANDNQVQILIDFDKAISWVDTPRVSENVVSFLDSNFSFDRVSLSLINSEKTHLDIVTNDDSVSGLSHGDTLELVGDPGENVLYSQSVRYVMDIDAIKSPNPVEKKLKHAGYKSFLIIPLLVGENVIGSLNIDSRNPDGLSEEDRTTLSLLSSRLTLALHHARLHSDLKEKERALEASERSYRELIDQAGDIIIKGDLQGKIIQVNAAASRMLGYTNGELLNMTISSLFYSGLPESAPLRYDLLEEGSTVISERIFVTRQGLHIPVEINSKKLSDGSIVSIIRDLTERKASSEQLLDQKNQISALFDAIPAPLYAKDNQGRYIMLNEAYLNFFGKKRSDMLGKTTTQVWPETTSAIKIEHNDQILLKNNDKQTFGAELKNGSGETRQVELRRSRYMNAQGEIAGFVGTIIDLTDLRAAEERYQTLFTYSPDPIVVHDGKNVVTANQAAIHFFKAESPETYFGKAVSSFLHPDSLKESKKRIQELFSSGHPSSLSQQKFIISTGETRDVEVMAALISTGDRRLVMSSFRDITEQKRAHDLLLASEEKYRSLIEMTPSPIIVHVDYHLVYANQSAIDFAGAKQPEDILGIDTRSMIHPSSIQQAIDNANKIFDSGRAQTETRLRFVRLNGDVRDVESSGTPVVFEGQQAIMVFFRDITNELQMQVELSSSEERYRRAFDYSPTAMILHDKGILVNANQAALAFIGTETVEDVRGKDLFSFVHPDFVQSTRDRIEEILRTDSATPTIEQKFLTFAGEERWVESRGFPVHFEEKKHLMVSFNDIHERVMARELVEESRQQLELVTQHIVNFILLVDLNFNLLYVNQSTANWLGKDTQELSGVPLKTVVPSGLLDIAKEYIPRLEAGEVCKYIQHFTSRSMGEVDFWIILIPVMDEKGALLAYLVQMENITDREVARRELAENKELLELIIDTIPGLFSYHDPKEKFLFVNQAYADWIGKEKSDIIGKTISETMSRKTYGEIEPYLKKIASGEEQQYTRASKDFEGNLHDFDVRNIPHLDKDQKLKAFLTSLQDVTEQRNAEKRQQALQDLAYSLTKATDLREVGVVSAATLRSIFESDAITIELYDHIQDLIVGVYSEDTFEGAIEPQEVPVNNIPFGTTPRYSKRFEAQCLNRTESELKAPKDTVPFGDSRPSRSLLFVPLRREGLAVGVISVQSYTEEKYNEEDLDLLQSFADQIGGALTRAQREEQILAHQQALEEEEKKYRSIIENAGDAVFVSTVKGDIITVNEQACQTLGYSQEELEGTNLSLFDPQLFQKLSPAKINALKTDLDSLTIESVHVRKNGFSFPVELRLSITEISGQSSLLCFARDISERKLGELREVALRNLAHDLNDSLNMYSVGEKAARSIHSFFDSDAFSIEFFNDEKQLIEGVYSEDTLEGANKPVPFPPKDTPFSEVKRDFFKRNGVTHVVNRTPKDFEALKRNRPFGSPRLSHSLLFAPIAWSKKNIGVLSVQSYTANKYSELDMPNIQIFADQIGNALLRAKKDEELSAKKDELQESEVKYRSIIGNAGDAVFVTTIQGDIHTVNENACVTSGYTETELIQMNISALVPAFFTHLNRKTMSPLKKSNQSITLETEQFRKNQSVFPVELRIGVMEIDRQLSILCFARDVTERNQAITRETSLRKLAHELNNTSNLHALGQIAAKSIRSLFESDTIIIELHDYKRELVVNVYTEDTFNGRSEPEEIAEDDIPFSEMPTSWLKENTGGTCINRAPGDLKDSNTILVGDSRPSHSLLFAPIRYKGKVVGMLSVHSYTPGKYSDSDLPLLQLCADQTGSALVRALKDEQIREQQVALLEEEKKYRTIIENAGDALFVVSFQGKILAFNQNATQSLGYTEEELLHRTFNVINPDFSKALPLKEKKKLSASQSSITMETEHTHKDGSRFPVELRVGTMELQGQACLLFFARDVSERKEGEIFRDALQRLARQLTVSLNPREVGALAASVLYDLFEYDAFALYRINFEKDIAVGLFAQDTFKTGDKPEEVETGVTPLDRDNKESVFLLPNPLLINRTKEQAYMTLATYGDTSRRSKSLVFAPIFWEGVQIGLLSVQSYKTNKFTEADLKKVKVFANQIGGALVRAQTDSVIQRQTKELKSREQELQASVKEKEVLLKEIYHRTKNNMQVIVGLLEMQSFKTPNEDVRDMLKEMTNRIYSMSMVHDLLYRSKSLSEIKLDVYLSNLVERLIAAYKTTLGDVSLDCKAQPIPINIQTAIPLGLVINEVVSNALKHAFPNNRDGQIYIRTKRLGENGLKITIGDNGTGIKSGFDLDTSGTLGMRIIRDIVELQLFGELSSSTKNRVEYYITIPDINLD